MNEAPPAKPRVTPVTPSNMQPPAHDGSTPHLLDASEGPLGGHAKGRLVRDAMVVEFKPCTTTLRDGLVSYDALFARNEVAQADAQTIFDDLPKEMYSKGRWGCKLPKRPQVERKIYGPFLEIMNHIIANIPSKSTRPLNDRWAEVSADEPQEQTSDAQRPSSKPEAPIKTRPDMVILGEDLKLLPPNLPLGDYYKRAISVGELKPDVEIPSKNPDKVEETRAQLGTYARQLFLQQHNRHFVIAYLATQDRFKLVRFDRGGPTEYPWINIHTQPVAFIKCIMLLAGQDLQKLGFDPTIYYNESGVRCIDVIERRPTLFGPQQPVEVTTYEHVTPLYHSRSIRGSGEVGWVGKQKNTVSLQDGPKKLIVDRWVHVDHLPEKEFYRRIEAAGRQKELSMLRPGSLEIVELLEVLRDAVLVHQDLLKKADVLHREFSLNTILINDSKDGGRKALLSGFAMAKTVFSETILQARGLGNDSLLDTDLHVAPMVFQSAYVLAPSTFHELRIQSFLDALEMVLHILVYMSMEYNGIGERNRVNPLTERTKFVQDYESTSKVSSEAKMLIMRKGAAKGQLTPYFQPGDIFTQLIDDLGSILLPYYDVPKGDPWAVPTGERQDGIYNAFVAAFDKAIGKLNKPANRFILVAPRPPTTPVKSGEKKSEVTVSPPRSASLSPLLPSVHGNPKGKSIQTVAGRLIRSASEELFLETIHEEPEEEVEGTATSAAVEDAVATDAEQERVEGPASVTTKAEPQERADEPSVTRVQRERVEEELKVNDQTDTGTKRKQRADEEKDENKKETPVDRKRAKPTEEDSGEE